VYFSQYGVLQDRAVEAVRYASLVTNGSASGEKTMYSLEDMYAEMAREGSSPAPTAVSAQDACTNGSAATSASSALTLQQGSLVAGSSPAPAPTYFRPDSTPQATCTEVPVLLPSPSAANLDNYGDYYFVVQVTTLNANKNVPGIVRAMTKLTATTTPVNAADGYPIPPSVAQTLYCSQTFTDTLAASIGADEPAPSAGSKYGMPTPSSGNSYPTIRPNC
jgi:hypothetical protein